MILRTYKNGTVFLCAALLLFSTGCAQNALPKARDTMEYNTVYTLTEADTDVNADNAAEVVFDGEQAVYLIDKPGDYLFTGKYDGQIQIDVQDEIVHLILDNVEIESPDGPAIYVKSAAKVVITVLKESTSTLTDSAYYTNFPEAKACIYSESDLTVNGGGSLNVYGYYKDAIRTKDTLKILDVNLAVQAKDTGLRGNDGVVIQTEALDIQCEGNGIYTEKADKKNKGFVDITGGTINIIAGEYGIDAAENIYIRDCKADIFGVIQNITCLGTQHIEEGCLE